MNHYPVKQVIILRKDLNYGTQGKKIAQACHASMAAITNEFIKENEGTWWFRPTSELVEWLNGSFAKIVLVVPTDKELLELYEEAKTFNLRTVKIEDDGATVFNGVKTLTAIAIGPAKSELLDEITHKDYVKLL